MNTQTMGAIFKRDFKSFFGSLTGYVFILAFVLLTAGFAFVPDDFAAQNKATLDQLSDFWFPVLLIFFVPAITMSTWAEEKKRGTEELLFTLPTHDHELVLAKFAARFGVYTTALAFTVTHVMVLEYLGNPDWGLLFGTYLGYWLLGGAFIAVAMLGSALTSNQTVAFVLGAALCAAFALLHEAAPVLGSAVAELGGMPRFESFWRGVVALGDVIYYGGLMAAGLYANAYVIGRRHWTNDKSKSLHGALRLASVAVVGVSLATLGGRMAWARWDVTAERMLSLTPEALGVLDSLDAKRPVLVHAWVSPEVPEPYQATREGLLRLLEEFDARGGDRLLVTVYETELYSEESQEAETRFGIKPQRVANEVDGRQTLDEIFLGLAFTCGSRELKIPFFDRGLPIQYELTRAIGSVAQLERPRIGILSSGANLFGGFDFQTMNRSEDWQILQDLRKQYEVEKIEGTAAIDTSLDVLVVPMPSSLPQPKMDRLAAYLYQGGKALMLCDPFPEFDRNLAPTRPAGSGGNPFQQNKPPSEPKGTIEPLFGAMGVSWTKTRCTWDAYNPHPEWQTIPRELIFVSPALEEGDESGFNEEDPVSSGLQELAMIFPGELEKAAGAPEELAFTPLLTTTTHSGYHDWGDMVQETFFGIMPKPEEFRVYESKGTRRTLAARIKNKLRAPSDAEGLKRGEVSQQEFEAIVVADMDIVSDVFYNLRRQGSSEFTLDNVTFVANCIDSLAGEDSYIKLRKLRPKHRTLTRLEGVEREAAKQQREVVKEAKDAAEEKLKEAQERLDNKVQEIEGRTDLDPRAKRVLLETERRREQRRFEKAEREIKDEEAAAIRLSLTKKNLDIRWERRVILGTVGLIIPIPVILLGCFILIRRSLLESSTIDAARRR